MGWTNLRGVGNDDALTAGLIFGDIRKSSGPISLLFVSTLLTNGSSSFDIIADTDMGLTEGAVGIKLVKGGNGHKESIGGNSCGGFKICLGELMDNIGESNGGKIVKLLFSCIDEEKGGLYDE